MKTIETHYGNGCSMAHIEALLGVIEGTSRHHVRRPASSAHCGRAAQARLVAGYAGAIGDCHAARSYGPINLSELHATSGR